MDNLAAKLKTLTEAITSGATTISEVLEAVGLGCVSKLITVGALLITCLIKICCDFFTGA